MKIRRKIGVVAGIIFSLLQGGYAANYIVENPTNTFWSIPRSWHTNTIWKDGVVVPSPSANNVIISSKPTDHTINLFEEPVSIQTLIIGSYANDADVVTLNVTTNLDISYQMTIGYSEGNGAMTVSNTSVSVDNKIYLGNNTTDIYSGNLTVNSNGTVETSDTFYMYTNGTLTVNDNGTVKMMAPSGGRISMVESSKIYLNDNAQLILNGDHTWSGSPLNTYADNGWVFGDGIAGNIDLSFDGTNTSVSVKPFATGNVVIQNNDTSFWDTPRNWYDHDIWLNGNLPAETANIIMTAKPTDYTVLISESPVTIASLKTKFGLSGTCTPTLQIQTNVTINNFVQMGVEENGAMIVDSVLPYVLVKGATTLGGSTYSASLTVTNGGVYRCHSTITMNANSTITISNGRVKMYNSSSAPLVMEEGARIYITGTNSLFEMWGDQSGTDSALSTYISNGWIYGDGVAGKVNVEYVSSNNLTFVSVPNSATYVGFTDEYGITGEPNSEPNEDYDGDGQINLYEWGLGGNPTNQNDIGTIPVYQFVEQGGTNIIQYIYPRRVEANISYHLETDTDLVALPSWTNTGYSVTGVGPEIDGFETVTNEVDASADAGFIKLIIEQL